MEKIVLLHEAGALEHIESVAPNPRSGNPVANVWRCFTRPGGKLNAGIWDCREGSFEIVSHSSDEMCSILEGEAVIEHEDGSRVTVRPGDSFMIPLGAHTVWHVREHVRKAFICVLPEQAG